MEVCGWRLELTDTGFDASVLSEFRTRLVEGHAEEQLLTSMLTLFKERGWRHPPAANSGPIRPMSWPRFAPSIAWSVWEKPCVMRFHCLAIVAPDWLLAHSQPEWAEGSGVRLEDSRLPSSEADRQSWVQSVGQDGSSLLSALFEPEAPSWLREVPDVETLRRVWVQN